MTPLIKDLWIFQKGGIPLVELYEGEEKLDKTFLGGVIAAFTSFSRQVSGCEIKGFNVGKHRFCLVRCFDGNVLILVKSPYDTKEKKIKDMCKVVEKIFEEMFSLRDIRKWDGDITEFNKFKTKLELYFKMGSL